jgi:hypothetical protein
MKANIIYWWPLGEKKTGVRLSIDNLTIWKHNILKMKDPDPLKIITDSDPGS